MNKPVMGAPRRRADVFANLERASDAIAEAPPVPTVSPAQEAPAAPAPQTTEVVHVGAQQGSRLDLDAIRAMKTRKEPTLQTNARLPISVLDDIDLIRRLTGTTLTEIVTAGTRAEVARLKKQYGLE